MIGVFLVFYPRNIAAVRRPHIRQNKNRPKVFILGDATMGRTARALSHILDDCNPIDSGNRCDVLSNETLSNDTARNSSNPESLSPVGLGTFRRGCEDCQDCHPMNWTCKEYDIEYFDVEFAAHPGFSNTHHGMTRSHRVAGYLKQNVRRGDFVASNIGFHNLAATSNTSLIYTDELESFVRVLLEVCSGPYIRWVTSAYPAGEQALPEWHNATSSPNPEVISQLNLESKALMKKHSIKVLDLAMISRLHHFQELRQDAIHIGDENQPWYRSVAFAIFVQFAGLIMSPTCEVRDCGGNISTVSTGSEGEGENKTLNFTI